MGSLYVTDANVRIVIERLIDQERCDQRTTNSWTHLSRIGENEWSRKSGKGGGKMASQSVVVNVLYVLRCLRYLRNKYDFDLIPLLGT